LGSAVITHPFHPLRGRQFAVLKKRRVSGIATLSVRHAELGSFALPQEWTDWGAPAEPAGSALVIDAFGLAALASIVDILLRNKQGG